MFDAGCELGRSAAERFANPVVLAFAAGLRINLEPLVSGVHQGAGRATPLFGGVAGDDLAMRQTLIFPGTEPTEAGVIGLVLDGSVSRWEALLRTGGSRLALPRQSPEPKAMSFT